MMLYTVCLFDWQGVSPFYVSKPTITSYYHSFRGYAVTTII